MERQSNGQFCKKTGLYYEPYYHILCQKLCDMRRRCTDPKDPSFYLYGARGIKVCAEWCGPNGHENFYRWAIDAGYKSGLSIDRIDNDGPYSPENCRWADSKTQANNRRNCRYITVGKITKTITEWAEIFGVSPDLAIRRYKRGCNFQELFSVPTVSTKPISVIRYPDGKIYKSARAAAIDCGGDPRKVRLVCNGSRKTHKGYSFRYCVEDDENE